MAAAESDDDVVIVSVTSPTAAAMDSACDAKRARKRARVDGPGGHGAGATTKSDDDIPLFRLLHTEVSAPSFPSTSSTPPPLPRGPPDECLSLHCTTTSQKHDFLLKPTFISKCKPRGCGSALLTKRQALHCTAASTSYMRLSPLHTWAAWGRSKVTHARENREGEGREREG